MELILFCFFSMNSLACCFFVAFLATPVNAVFYLVLAFCNAAGLLILVETEFLALLFLIVYVGAIAVLFLFVIIILNLKEPISTNPVFFLTESDKQNVVIFSYIFVILFFQTLSLFSFDFVSLQKNVDYFPVNYTEWVFYLDFFPNIELFGQLVYTYFFFYFLVAGFILLVAMVSSVVLTAQKKNNNKRQLAFSQLARTGNFSVFLVSRNTANVDKRL
jgi:NADH-quinone oxidoreductase subunit J